MIAFWKSEDWLKNVRAAMSDTTLGPREVFSECMTLAMRSGWAAMEDSGADSKLNHVRTALDAAIAKLLQIRADV